MVSYFTPGRKSRGSDYTITMRLKDPSWLQAQGPATDGVQIVIFAREQSFLPDVRHVGDVVRLHRVRVQSHQMKRQVVANKFNFSALTFDGAAAAPATPRHSSSPSSYAWSPQDGQRVRDLRAWANTVAGLGADSLVCAVQDVAVNTEMDAIGQITSVFAKDHNLTVIEFADGTMPSDFCRQDMEHGQPPHSVLSAVAVRCSVSIRAWDEVARKAAGLHVGQMVRISGLTARLNNDGNKWILDLRKDITSLDNDHPDVQQARQRLDPRIDPDIPASPQSSRGGHDHDRGAAHTMPRTTFTARTAPAPTATAPSLPAAAQGGSGVAGPSHAGGKRQAAYPDVRTEVKDALAPVSTLADVAQAPPLCKFRCRVRCREVTPSNICDFTMAVCRRRQQGYTREALAAREGGAANLLCDSCDPPHQLEYVYTFQLVLEDETGHVEVILCDEDAAEFLGASRPRRVPARTSPSARAHVRALPRCGTLAVAWRRVHGLTACPMFPLLWGQAPTTPPWTSTRTRPRVRRSRSE